MIRLTKFGDDTTLIVGALHIVKARDSGKGKGTAVLLTSGDTITVKETVDSIFATVTATLRMMHHGA